MPKYSVNIEIPVIRTEVHEVTVEAESSAEAQLKAQGLTYGQKTMYKRLEDQRAPGPYKINHCWRVLNDD